jgi:hypothetical protein
VLVSPWLVVQNGSRAGKMGTAQHPVVQPAQLLCGRHVQGPLLQLQWLVRLHTAGVWLGTLVACAAGLWRCLCCMHQMYASACMAFGWCSRGVWQVKSTWVACLGHVTYT